MKEIRKKSADSAVNTLIVKAYRGQTDLAWDRADAMQPQCGFARMGICCTDCYEGPCRTNPFADDEQYTICGRSQADLVASSFLKQTVIGAAALVSLADQFGVEVDKTTFNAVMPMGDCMTCPVDYTKRYDEIGQAVVQALTAISGVKAKKELAEATVNLGVLQASAINILLHGHTPPRTTSLLFAAVDKQTFPVNIIGMCGGEASGKYPVPAVTNYDSQETPLLTGAVDLLVIGSQCVMPAALLLAEKLGVPVMSADDIVDTAAAGRALAIASERFQQRAQKALDIPERVTAMTVGNSGVSVPILEALAKGYARGIVRGIVYIGGCGNIINTQDAAVVKLAQELMNDGYYIVTAGCAGLSLAKAGMAQPGYAGVLNDVLPTGAPAVFYIGSCHDAGEFLCIAKSAQDRGMPVFAVMPEITQTKVLATAAGFLTQGITTYVGLGEAAHIPSISLKGRLLPLSELRQPLQALAEVAAAK